MCLSGSYFLCNLSGFNDAIFEKSLTTSVNVLSPRDRKKYYNWNTIPNIIILFSNYNLKLIHKLFFHLNVE